MKSPASALLLVMILGCSDRRPQGTPPERVQETTRQEMRADRQMSNRDGYYGGPNTDPR